MALDMCLRPVVTQMLLYRHKVNGCSYMYSHKRKNANVVERCKFCIFMLMY